MIRTLTAGRRSGQRRAESVHTICSTSIARGTPCRSIGWSWPIPLPTPRSATTSELGGVSAWASCSPAWGFTGSAFTTHVHIGCVRSSSDHLGLHERLLWPCQLLGLRPPLTCHCRAPSASGSGRAGGREEQYLTLQAQASEDCATCGQARGPPGQSLQT